ncbi:MAG: D-arabinono-1,4-lactone oxidase [Caldilineaceae bacterium]
MSHPWANWSGSVMSAPRTVATPTTEADLVSIVQAAKRTNRSIRVVGTGHSFVPLCATDDLLISLDGLQGLIAVDQGSHTATLWAGTKLHAVGEPLWEHGLAMANMGDIDRQSLGGAIGTGTHGTGPTLGNISTQVVGLRLLTATGELITCSTTEEPAIFTAAQVSLGALGIVTQVTLRCLPAYELHERTWVADFAKCMAALDDHIAATRHFEFFWVPGEDVCAMKALHPVETHTTPPPSTPLLHLPEGRLARYVRAPQTDRSYRIFPSERNLKFNETEFALPAATGPDCLREVRQLMQTRYRDVAWPIEYRTLAADDIPLSPAHGRKTVTISVHQAADLPYQPFFADVEAIFRNHQGRPHWGKLHTHRARNLAALYPAWNTFQAVRAQLDPEGSMLNSHLQELLLPAD